MYEGTLIRSCYPMICFAVAAAPLVAACHERSPLEPPAHLREEVQLTLTEKDCDDYLDTFGYNPFPADGIPVRWDSLETEIHYRLQSIASEWAIRECYLPCPFEMSGCVTQHPDGRYGVYIGPTEFKPAIRAEAMILVDPIATSIVEEIRFHSACTDYRGWVRPTCSD